MRRQIGMLTLSAIIAAGAAGAWFWHSPAGPQSVPPFRVESLEGVPIESSQWAGRPVLVTFWASNCPQCAAEVPELNRMQQEFGPRGLRVLGVAVKWDEAGRLAEAVWLRGVRYPVAHDSDGAVARAFGQIRATPTSFLIGPDGRILERKVGALDWQRLRGQVEEMLGARAPSG